MLGTLRTPLPTYMPMRMTVTAEETFTPKHPPVAELRASVEKGGAARYHESNAAKGKLFARERGALLVDEGSCVEEGLFVNVLAGDLPADGVVTGHATIDGRPVCIMANDSTVK